MKKSLFIILLVVLILEITLFNVNSYRVLNNDSKIEYTKEELEYFETNPEETYIEIKNINTEIKTIHIVSVILFRWAIISISIWMFDYLMKIRTGTANIRVLRHIR